MSKIKRLLSFLFMFYFFSANSQNKVQLFQNGWLLYNYGSCLAFFPIKDQSKIPTYKNFFSEEKGDGQRMNNSYTAPPKLLIAKKYRVKSYQYDFKKKGYNFTGKKTYYIQPAKLEYYLDNISADTTDYQNGGCFWTFLIKGKYVEHNAYHFTERNSPVIYFQTKNDSLFAKNGGRRKDISIFPPH